MLSLSVVKTLTQSLDTCPESAVVLVNPSHKPHNFWFNRRRTNVTMRTKQFCTRGGNISVVTKKPTAAKKTSSSPSKKQSKQKKETKVPARAGATAQPKSPPAPVSVKKMQRPANTRIIAVCNQKGGCGKTTTIINVAASLALLGQRVLVVDLDSQANATVGLGVQTDDVDKSTFELLADQKNTTIEDVIIETEYENLHLAPASIILSEFESRVASEIGRENRLKKALAPLRGLYDIILIDTPPSLGLLSVNALNAATEVHIALQAHPFAFDGLNLLLESIELIKEELNPALQISGIIITMFDPRTKIAHEIVQKVLSMPALKNHVFKSVIHQNVKLTEATRMRKPVIYYNPGSVGADDYLGLSQEICKQNLEKSTAKKAPQSKQKNY